MKKNKQLNWLKEPAADNYEAAEKYLELLYEPKQARQLTKKLRRVGMSEYAAKDILRASDTSILYLQAYDWTKQQNEIHQGAPLSPILLVRRENAGPLIVADGFHRLCAVFTENEQITVPCKIV